MEGPMKQVLSLFILGLMTTTFVHAEELGQKDKTTCPKIQQGQRAQIELPETDAEKSKVDKKKKDASNQSV